VSYSYWSVGGVLISLPKAASPYGGNTTIVCDAWPVRRQTFGSLPRLRWYQNDLYCLVTVDCPYPTKNLFAV